MSNSHGGTAVARVCVVYPIYVDKCQAVTIFALLLVSPSLNSQGELIVLVVTCKL